MAKRGILGDRKGAAAVEFALVAPVFLLMLLSLIAFGIYISVANSVQQIAADAARAAVAGLDPDERQALAQEFIQRSTLDHYLVDPSRLSVSLLTDEENQRQFTVQVEYDARTLPIWTLYSFAMPNDRIRRVSIIRIGGA